MSRPHAAIELKAWTLLAVPEAHANFDYGVCTDPDDPANDTTMGGEVSGPRARDSAFRSL